ncbi:MAG: PilZ domain-containing protein [Kofleriaceae bacterium]
MRVVLRLAGPSDWIRVFDARDGTLAVAMTPAPSVGTSLRVDLSCGPQGPRVIFRGSVVGMRGADVALVGLGPTEREKVNYLNGFVRGGLLDLRAGRRLPVRLPVTYGGLKGAVATHTRDINEHGVFVLTEEPLPEGAEVHLIITLPDRADALNVVGRVTHTVVPEDEDVPGMGVVFRAADAETVDMAALIDGLERAFLDGSLPEALLE